MLGRSPTATSHGQAVPAKPPSSSGLGLRPFKAAARVRIPLGARTTHGPVEQLECSPPCQGGGRGFKSRQDRHAPVRDDLSCCTVRIAATPQQVWDVLADVERWPTWTPSVTSVTRLDSGPLGWVPGVRIKQPPLPVTTWTVSERSPGESCIRILPAGPSNHRPSPRRFGSIVTLVLEQDGPIGRVVGQLTAGLTNKYPAMEGNGLKAHVERRTRTP